MKDQKDPMSRAPIGTNIDPVARPAERQNRCH